MESFQFYLSVMILQAAVIGYVAATRSPMARTTFHMVVYVWVCEVVFLLLYTNSIYNQEGLPGRLMAEARIPLQSFLMYVCLFFFFLFAEYCCAKTEGNVLGSATKVNIDLSKYSGAIVGLSALCFFFAVLHMLSRDWDIVWDSQKYLQLQGAEGDSLLFPGAPIIRSLFSPICLASFILLAVASVTANRVAMVLLIVPCLWGFLFFLSGASRLATICLFAYAAVEFLLSKKKPLVRISLVILAGFAVLIAVLFGRGQKMFGMSHLWDIIVLPFMQPGGASIVMLNLLQGAVVTMDGMLVLGQHAFSYEIRAISPFPSFIDGFNQIRDLQELRLHSFVPMSGITEVIRFGPYFWFGVGLAYIVMATNINSKRTLKDLGPLVVVGANLLFTMYTVIAFSYPLRNTFRQLIYLFVLIMLIRFVRRALSGAKTRYAPPPVPMRGMRRPVAQTAATMRQRGLTR